MNRTKLTVALLTAFLLGCLVFGAPYVAGAAPLATGANSTDTVFNDDGTAVFVLSSGASTLSVVSPDTWTIVSTIPLGVGPGTAIDIDWHQPMQSGWSWAAATGRS